MLVAVAAMAFTACSQDVNEVNKVEKVTRYEFTAEIADDTRSGFAEKEEGATAYKSEWFGNETIKVFVTNYNGYNVETTAPINAKGQFTLELENAPESFFVTVVSPAESWASEYTANIPAEQTPLANSVDPLAHILMAQNVYVTNGSADAAKMDHQVAYGKMTVNGVDFDIDHVVVDLKGSYYNNPRELSYTINADNVENNTFWFATEPIDVAEFTVTAYDAEGNAVAKTVDVAEAGKTMSFAYGRVGTFSVSGLEVPAVPAFSRAYKSGNSYTDFYLYFEDDVLGVLKLNPSAMANPNWEMILGTYNIGYNYAGNPFFYPGQYSTYKGTYLNSGVVSFSAVDGQYLVEFTDIADENGKVVLERAMYKGTIEGLNIPDSRTQLATPNATATVDGNVITISWNEVTGADEYYVSCTTGGLDAITTAETSVTIEAEYSTKYDFSIKAVAFDSNPDYKTSGVYNFSVTTGKDPNAVIPEFTTIKYIGTEVTYASYNEYCHVFELTNSDNYKMNLYVGSYQSSSTHIEVGSYHYEGKENLGYERTQWGFQAKVWTTDGYLGSANSNSSMIVEKSGDIYNIDFTLIMDGKTHFFVCNAAIGGNEPDPTPDPEPEPDPDPEYPKTITVKVACAWDACNIWAWYADGSGNVYTEWPGEAMTKGEDGFYAIDMTIESPVYFKVNAGLGKTESDNYMTELSESTCFNMDGLALVVNEDCEYEEPIEIEPYYGIRGLVSWEMADDIKLTEDADKAEWYITNVKVDGTQEFKVVYVDKTGAATWFGSEAVELQEGLVNNGTDNIILAAGKYDIYFKANDGMMWIQFSAETPTDVEDAAAELIYAIDGTIIAPAPFAIIDLSGKDVTNANGSLQGTYIVKTLNSATKISVK